MRPSAIAFSASSSSAALIDVTSIGKKRVMTNQPTASRQATSGRLASAHSRKVKVCPVASRTMPSASGPRAPPRSVAIAMISKIGATISDRR